MIRQPRRDEGGDRVHVLKCMQRHTHNLDIGCASTRETTGPGHVVGGAAHRAPRAMGTIAILPTLLFILLLVLLIVAVFLFIQLLKHGVELSGLSCPAEALCESGAAATPEEANELPSTAGLLLPILYEGVGHERRGLKLVGEGSKTSEILAPCSWQVVVDHELGIATGGRGVAPGPMHNNDNNGREFHGALYLAACRRCPKRGLSAEATGAAHARCWRLGVASARRRNTPRARPLAHFRWRWRYGLVCCAALRPSLAALHHSPGLSRRLGLCEDHDGVTALKALQQLLQPPRLGVVVRTADETTLVHHTAEATRGDLRRG
mmetsp:Transcript_60006/g.128781  ORF Transcript_60006/g.128781 Transcript_60006/m.128781 type:complete len:321 (-) Transcript_60006:312-1274(-)